MSDNDMQDALPTCSCCESTNELVEVRGDLYCPTHTAYELFVCDRCSDWEHVDYMCHISHCDDYDLSWCSECSDNYSWYCDDCDVSHDGTHQHNLGLDLECYSYKPVPEFHGDDPGWLYFGAEIEMESERGAGAEALEYLRNKLGWAAYYKSDGSIMSEDGFEMVTHPRTLESWQAWLPSLQDAMQFARKVGMRSWNTDTCGIHIHIDSRAFTSSAHLYRFTQMIYRNETEMQRIAGRGSVHYAEYIHSARVAAGVVKDRKRYGGSGDRYVAVNLQNQRTVEVRMFRGSLRPERLVANVELLHALVTYTRDMTVRQAFDGGLRFPKFLAHISASPTTYPNLIALITRDFDMSRA